MRKQDDGDSSGEVVDRLIDEITVDANGEDEQLWAFRQAFDDGIRVPCDAFVVGQGVPSARLSDPLLGPRGDRSYLRQNTVWRVP
jgi:hypothetical protein